MTLSIKSKLIDNYLVEDKILKNIDIKKALMEFIDIKDMQKLGLWYFVDGALPNYDKYCFFFIF